MKQKFKLEDNRIVYIRQEDDKGRIKIYLETKQKEMIEQVYEIPMLENNGDIQHYLIVVMPKKKYY